MQYLGQEKSWAFESDRAGLIPAFSVIVWPSTSCKNSMSFNFLFYKGFYNICCKNNYVIIYYT